MLAHSSIMRLRGRQVVVSTCMLGLEVDPVVGPSGAVVSTCMLGLEVDPVVGPPILRPAVCARWLHIRMK